MEGNDCEDPMAETQSLLGNKVYLRNKWIGHLVISVVLVVCALLALIFTVNNTTDLPVPPRTKYGLVFDAGSSHTSLYIYQWRADKENNTGIVAQASVCNVEGPGISSYANNPPEAGKSLINCLKQAMGYISQESQKETPVFLGATAGMRLLRDRNKNTSDQVLDEVSKAIRNYSVDFRGAQIISGEQEGSCGWISINYRLESLIKYSFRFHWVHPSTSTIYGAMDLGGASTQISFIPKEDIKDPKEKEEFSLYGYPYTIYTHSYLCYGLNEALRKTLVNTITGQDVKKPINAPCYPKGYTNTTSVKSLYVLPCISAPPPSSEQVTLMGTGDVAQCRTLIQSIFNFSACGNRTQCSFDGVYQPPVVGDFYAFSAFYTVFRFLNLTSGQSLMEVNSTIWSFCSREWSELKSSYPGVEPDHLRDCCPSSIYILTLLLDAYKFNATTWSSIRFVKQEHNTDIGWTLGYMLNLTNMIPADHVISMKGHDNNIWGAAITFIIFSLLLSLYMLFNYVKRLYQYGAGQY